MIGEQAVWSALPAAVAIVLAVAAMTGVRRAEVARVLPGAILGIALALPTLGLAVLLILLGRIKLG